MIRPLTMTGKRRLMPGAPFVPAAALGKGAGVPAWVLSGAALDLDFAEARGFNSLDRSKLTPDSILTYTAPSPKMVYGDDGVLRYAPHNRWLQSQTFDNASWIKNSGSISADAASAPDGTLTADKFIEAAATAVHYLQQNFDAAGQTINVSVYAKAAERNIVYIRFTNSAAASAYVWFNVSTGEVLTTNAGITATIVDAGSGFYRCSASIAAYNGTGTYGIGVSNADASASYAGDGTSGLFVWGAQFSLGSSALTYVPTTSAAKYNLPIDHDPITFDPLGVLIEEQRTNLLTYSEQFDNAAWTKSRATVTANALASPDGTTAADKLVPSVDVGTHRVYQTGITHGVLRTYAYTCYLKAGEYTFARLALTDAIEADAAHCRFNLSNGTLDGVATHSGTFSGSSASVEDVGNGWYRCTLIATCDATEATVAAWVHSGNTTAGVNTFAGDGTSGIYVWGAQLEAGAFPTSYIPTVASQVTRAADQVSILTSAFAFSAIEGTLYTEGRITSAGTAYFGGLSDNSGSDTELMGNRKSGTSYGSIVVDGGVTQASLTGGSYVAGSEVEMAFAYKANDCALSIDGAAVITDVSATLPTVTGLYVGAIRNALGYANGPIKRLTYFPTRKSNAELQALAA